MADQHTEPDRRPAEDGETGDGTTPSGESADADELPPAVVEAVRENPEAVAALLQRLDAVNDLLDATAVATAGLDDEMVMRLAETGTNLGAAADGMATPETAALGESVGENAAELAAGVETVARLQRDGTLETLAQVGELVALAEGALDDEMVTTLAATGSRLGEVADEAADEDVVRGLTGTMRAVGEASDPDDPPAPVGALGLLGAMRDPEVKAGMGWLVALAKALGAELGGGRR